MQHVSDPSQGLYLVRPQFKTFPFKDVYSSTFLLGFKCEVLLGRKENHNDVADESTHTHTHTHTHTAVHSDCIWRSEVTSVLLCPAIVSLNTPSSPSHCSLWP